MRTRLVTLGAILIIALGACGWTQPGFDSGHSQSNPSETRLTAANVNSLESHTVTVANASVDSFFVVGPWLIVNAGGNAVAYDRTACPRADNGACTPIWTRTNRTFKSSNGTSVMFFSTGINTFEATDMMGTTLWDATTSGATGPSTGNFSAKAFTISGTNLLVAIDQYLGHGSSAAVMNVFSTTGCGAPTCIPARTIPLRGGPVTDPPWAASGNVLYTDAGVFDVTSGARLWSFDGDAFFLQVRNGKVYASREGPPAAVDVFDAAGSAGCSGAPKICQPIQKLQNGVTRAVSSRLVTASTLAGSSGPDAKLFLYPTDGSTCSTAPATCAPAATATLGSSTSFVSSVASTEQLVFATGQTTGPLPATNHSLFAFDGALGNGCAGAPKVCTPLFTFTLTNINLGQPEIWGGRVYAAGSNGKLYVFSLPGDVS